MSQITADPLLESVRALRRKPAAAPAQPAPDPLLESVRSLRRKPGAVAQAAGQPTPIPPAPDDPYSDQDRAPALPPTAMPSAAPPAPVLPLASHLRDSYEFDNRGEFVQPAPQPARSGASPELVQAIGRSVGDELAGRAAPGPQMSEGGGIPAPQPTAPSRTIVGDAAAAAGQVVPKVGEALSAFKTSVVGPLVGYFSPEIGQNITEGGRQAGEELHRATQELGQGPVEGGTVNRFAHAAARFAGGLAPYLAAPGAAGPALAGAAGFGEAYGDLKVRLLSHGLTDEQAEQGAIKGAPIVGAVDALLFKMVGDRAGGGQAAPAADVVAGFVRKRAVDALVGAGFGAGSEVGRQVGANVAGIPDSFDPEKVVQAGEEGAVGFAVFGALHDAVASLAPSPERQWASDLLRSYSKEIADTARGMNDADLVAFRDRVQASKAINRTAKRDIGKIIDDEMDAREAGQARVSTVDQGQVVEPAKPTLAQPRKKAAKPQPQETVDVQASEERPVNPQGQPGDAGQGQGEPGVQEQPVPGPAEQPPQDVLSGPWHRGISEHNAAAGDRFYSSDPSVAAEFSGGKATEQLADAQRPKNPLVVGSKDDLAEAIGYKGDARAEPLDTPAGQKFDALAKRYAQERGHDAIVYENGTFDAPEMHVFGDEKDKAQAEPRYPKARLSTELEAGGVPRFVLKPFEGTTRAGQQVMPKASETLEKIGRGEEGDEIPDAVRIKALTESLNRQGELDGIQLQAIKAADLKPGDEWDIDRRWKMQVDRVEKDPFEGGEVVVLSAHDRNQIPLGDGEYHTPEPITFHVGRGETLPGNAGSLRAAPENPPEAPAPPPEKTSGQQLGLLGDRYAGGITGGQSTMPFPEPSAIEKETAAKQSAADDQETMPMFGGQDPAKLSFKDLQAAAKAAGIDPKVGRAEMVRQLKEKQVRDERFEQLRGELQAATGQEYSDEAVQAHIDAAGGESAEDVTPPQRSGSVASVTAKGQREIGINAAGNKVYEDDRGVRSYVEGGVRITEPVRLGPRGEFAGPSGKRGAEFEPAEKQTDDKPHKFSSTQLNLYGSVADQIKAAAAKIPDADLAEDGREDTPHITVKYGLHTENADQMRAFLRDQGPIEATIGKLSVFPAKQGADYDVVKADIESPQLRALNKEISDSFEHTDTHPTYQPHVTLAYVKAGLGEKYAKEISTGLTGTKLTLGALTFSDRSGNKTTIPLHGPLVVKSLQGETIKTISTAERPAADMADQWDAMDYGQRQEIVQHSVYKDSRKIVHRIAGSKWSQLGEGEHAEIEKAMRATGAGQKPAASPSAAEAPQLATARDVADLLAKGHKITPHMLFSAAAKHYGGGLASAKFSAKDAYDAAELGINLHIRQNAKAIDPTASLDAAKHAAALLDDLTGLLPTQTRRDAETDSMQQFSTPPPYAYAVNWVANLGNGETVLEPSAGTGSIAVHAINAGARVVVNELAKDRAELVKALDPAAVYTENAEQIAKLIKPQDRPSVVVMNPPFSQTAGRMGDKMQPMTGARHIEEALKALKDGGRLVAIVGRGMAPEAKSFMGWWKGIASKYTVRANVGVSGDVYKKYGTAFGTRLLVIDKTGPTEGGSMSPSIVTGMVDSVPDLLDKLAGVRNARVRPTEQPSVAPSGEIASGEGGRAPAAGQAVRAPAHELGAPKPEGQSGPPSRPAAGGQPGQHAPSLGAGGGARVPAGTESGREPGGPGGVAKPGPGAGGEVASGRAERPASGEGAGVQHPASAGLTLEKPPDEAAHKEVGELQEAVYETYRPRKVRIAGAHGHPTALVESAAMAAVPPPDPTYKPSLPAATVSEGKLSDAQIESVVYAGQAHEQMLPDGRRKGFFIGDGTGVGKGREIAGVMQDNIAKGRTKHIWVSEKPDLIESAKRDVQGVGGDPSMLFPINKVGARDKIDKAKGVAFVSYSTLRGGSKGEGGKEGVKRLQQILDWVGPDFDGVIAFDESHNMANAVAMQEQGKRGATEVSQAAAAGIELMNKLPKARVLFVSATGATEVRNLAYAERLGLWGEGSPFPNKQDFIAKVSSGGIAAMELVARDLKALGLYIARNQSFDGVHQTQLTHELSAEQESIYNELADGWQLVYQNLNEALGLVASNEESGKIDANAKMAAYSLFYSTQQRFWNQILTAMQMPSVIKAMEADLEAGHAVVAQIVNTDEAAQTRALSAMEEGDALEDLDLTPRQQLMEYIRRGFPVAQMESYEDPNTEKVLMRPVKDSQGNLVENPEAVALREALLDKLGSIRVPDGALDTLINHFGAEKVAEITGRKERRELVREDDGTEKMKMVKRRSGINLAEEKAFRDDKKRILVFSQAGGTGSSYHADKTFTNQRKRMHYLVQAGWRADKAVQGLGRTKRTNEKQPPEYRLVTTNIPGHKRFISTIARRLDQLGALTKGQRQTGSQGLFNAKSNLENEYARNALHRLYQDIVRGELRGMSLEDFEAATGLRLIDKDGRILQQLPPIGRFLNRVLSLRVDAQNRLFGEFEKRLDENIRHAQEMGNLDVGVETYKADGIQKVSEDVIHTDPASGAQTKIVKLDVKSRSETLPWKEAEKLAGAAGYFARNRKSGNVFLVGGSVVQKTDPKNGSITQGRSITDTRGRRRFAAMDDLGDDKFESLKREDAKQLWNEQVAKIPEFEHEPAHIITGAILPVWDRLKGPTRVWRLKTDDGEKMLGRVIPEDLVPSTLARFGVNRKGDIPITPEDAAEWVGNKGYTLNLSNGWQIKRAAVAGETRIELVGPDYEHNAELARQGVFTERHNYKTRYFIPTGNVARTANVIGAITKHRDIIEAVAPGGKKPAQGDTPDGGSNWTDANQPDARKPPDHGRAGMVINPFPEDFFKKLSDEAKALIVQDVAGESVPLHYKYGKALLGDAAARYGAARKAAIPVADSMAADVLGRKLGNATFRNKLGAVLVEDQLRKTRQNFLDAGDTAKAGAVQTLVGPHKGAAFKTEAEYQAALNDPAILDALDRDRKIGMPAREVIFERAGGTPNPDARGLETGIHLSLMAVPDDGSVPRSHYASGAKQGNPGNVKETKSRFNRQRTGASSTGYVTDYLDLLRNQIGGDFERAAQQVYYRALVRSGSAKIDQRGGQAHTLADGEGTTGFQTKQWAYLTEREKVNEETGEPESEPAIGRGAKWLYVRNSLVNEYRDLTNLDASRRIPLLTSAATAAIRSQLMQALDYSSHTRTQLAALRKAVASSGSTLANILRQVPALGDIANWGLVAGHVIKTGTEIMLDTPEIRRALAEIATIGAGGPSEHRGHKANPLAWLGMLRNVQDKIVRVQLNRGFDWLVQHMGVADTERNRREYINGWLGQYEARLQGRLTRALRETGASPYVVASKARIARTMRVVAGFNPAIKDSQSRAVGLLLRAMQLNLTVAGYITAGLITYALTKKFMPPAGVPIGGVPLKKDPKTGKWDYLNYVQATGADEAVRGTGSRAAIEGYRSGQPGWQIVSRAIDDITQPIEHMLGGPAVNAALIAAYGRDWRGLVSGRRTVPMTADALKQGWANVGGAISSLNEPAAWMLKSGLSMVSPDAAKAVFNQDDEPGTVACKQLGPFRIMQGKSDEEAKSLPKRIEGARLNDFIDDLASRARKIPASDRAKFITEQIKDLPAKDAARVRRTLFGEKRIMRRVPGVDPEAVSR